MATPLVKISYVNVSGVAIPPFGVLQLVGECIITPTGDYIVQATVPGYGNGPFLVDAGKGTDAAGAGSYGQCIRPVNGLCWVAYGCTAPPSIPWQEVGPVIGSFIVSTFGSGYLYAGRYDATNSRILCLMSDFSPTATECGSTPSSGSQSGSADTSGSGSGDGSGSGSGGSGSGSGGNCIDVVTKVRCINGSLEVTYGRAVGC